MIHHMCLGMIALATVIAAAAAWNAYDTRVRLHRATIEGYGYSVGLPGSNL